MEGIYEEVVLTDPNGKEVRFDHPLTFSYEGKLYAALLPIDEVEGVAEDEVLFMNISKGEDGNDVYTTVTNGVLLDELFDEFIRLIDEMLDEE